MNHACDGAPLTSAVPVLPAIRQWWSLRLRPVPTSTASRRYRPKRAAAGRGRSDWVRRVQKKPPDGVHEAHHRCDGGGNRAIRSGVATTSP